MRSAGEFLAVGTVRRPHGVRGELLIALETDRPTAVYAAGRLLHLGDPTGRPTGRTLTVERARPFQDGLLLKLVELQGRTPEVEAMRGHSLLIPAAEAAPAAPDEVHYRDLLGMAVVAGGERVGTVRDVMETAGGELLVVQRQGRRELLVPFVREMVREIDREARTLTIEPPEGLLEL